MCCSRIRDRCNLTLCAQKIDALRKKLGRTAYIAWRSNGLTKSISKYVYRMGAGNASEVGDTKKVCSIRLESENARRNKRKLVRAARGKQGDQRGKGGKKKHGKSHGHLALTLAGEAARRASPPQQTREGRIKYRKHIAEPEEGRLDFAQLAKRFKLQ